MEKCGTCNHFIGGGDFGLCCDLPHPEYPCGFLCYKDSEACEAYTPIRYFNEWLDYINKLERKKNLVLYIGDIYICLGRNVPSETLINFLGEKRINWLNNNKPEKVELSIDKIEIHYHKSKKFEALCEAKYDFSTDAEVSK